MPLNIKGKIVTGEDARAEIVDKIITKQGLTIKDLEFILTKLKSAEYKGSEFEHFYAVWVKLSNKLEELKNKE
tara:strand:- start:804 stop:1022 length:219 start_codon:yes stop_codon:yes gene_type:complete